MNQDILVVSKSPAQGPAVYPSAEFVRSGSYVKL